jgi:acyl carrier protein phosphodiesterase
MNFLAHCLIPDRALDFTHPDLIAGGFVGDFLKGPVPEDLPAMLATGVRLHRRIDAYSNEHAGIRKSCARFPPELRRFAPIFVDVVADHLLARHWQRFHPAPLTAFTARAYEAIRPHVNRLPESGRRLFDFMTEQDLLARYREPDTMHQSLRSVTRRLDRQALNEAMHEAVDSRLPALEADFLDYFPDLIHHAAAWLDDRQTRERQ